MKYRLMLIIIFAGPMVLSAQQIEKRLELPVLPSSVKVTHLKSNPLKDALQPVPESAIFKMDGYFLWDPSLIKAGDKYHLFCSRWPAKSGMEGWKKSQVIRATSDSLFGPYQFEEVVLDPAEHPWATQGVHNPKITKAGNKFLLYYLGIPQWKTGFALADQISGPWQIIDHPVIATNNPAIIVRTDGSAYAVGKFKPKITKDGKWDANMQSFEATEYLGPYKLVQDTLNRLPADFELEDPTLWWANNQYNVVCTDWEAKVTGVQKSVIYYTSNDGIEYKLYSQVPVWSQNEAIPMRSGQKLRIKGVERPQVYTNDAGAVIALLASIYPDPSGATFIIIRPVNHFTPEN